MCVRAVSSPKPTLVSIEAILKVFHDLSVQIKLMASSWMIGCISNETTTSRTRDNSVGNEILLMKYQQSSKPTDKRVIQVPTDLDLIQFVEESLLEEEKLKKSQEECRCCEE